MDRRELLIRAAAPVAFTIALFLVWEAICRALAVPLTILPAPSDIFDALWRYRAPIVDNSWVTLWTTLAGFLIATAFGLVLGIAVGWHRALYAGIYPVLVGFNSIPKVAVPPTLQQTRDVAHGTRHSRPAGRPACADKPRRTTTALASAEAEIPRNA